MHARERESLTLACGQLYPCPTSTRVVSPEVEVDHGRTESSDMGEADIGPKVRMSRRRHA